MPDWAAAFDAPVYLHARDREWVMRPDDRVVFWEEDERALAPGLTLLRLGGHFPGGSVLHWRDGAEGHGALLAGNIVQVGADLKTVSSCGATRTGCRSPAAPSSAARRRATGISWRRISPDVFPGAAPGGSGEQRRAGQRADEGGEAEAPPLALCAGRTRFGRRHRIASCKTVRRDRVFAHDLYHSRGEPGHRCQRERAACRGADGPRRIGRPAAKTIEPEPSPPRVASEWSRSL